MCAALKPKLVPSREDRYEPTRQFRLLPGGISVFAVGWLTGQRAIRESLLLDTDKPLSQS